MRPYSKIIDEISSEISVSIESLNSIKDILLQCLDGSQQTIPTISNPFSSSAKKITTVHSLQQPGISQTDKVQCFFCESLVHLKSMRTHIGVHILKKQIAPDQNTCGFCGKIGCRVNLIKTSGKGKYATYGLLSL